MDNHLPADADNFDPRQRDQEVNPPCCHLSERDQLVFDPAQFAHSEEQSRLRHILIGHPDDVQQEILNFYRCGYEIHGWSPPQAVPTTGEVVRVYTKRSRRKSRRG